jgi:hypothetical protein
MRIESIVRVLLGCAAKISASEALPHLVHPCAVNTRHRPFAARTETAGLAQMAPVMETRLMRVIRVIEHHHISHLTTANGGIETDVTNTVPLAV